MPYAIYQLHVNGQLHREFSSRKKTKLEVMTDLVRYLQSIADRKEVPMPRRAPAPTVDHPGPDAGLQNSFFVMSDMLRGVSIRVLHIIDAETEKKLDLLIQFLELVPQYERRLNHEEHREYVISMSQLSFGVKRVLAQMFSPFWPELEPETVKNHIDSLNWCHANVAAFVYMMDNMPLDDTTFVERYRQLAEKAKQVTA